MVIPVYYTLTIDDGSIFSWDGSSDSILRGGHCFTTDGKAFLLFNCRAYGILYSCNGSGVCLVSFNLVVHFCTAGTVGKVKVTLNIQSQL